MAKRRRRAPRKKNPFLKIVIVAAIVCGLIAAKAPWEMYREQARNVSSMRKELKDLKKAEIKHAETTDASTNPVEMEEKARRDGWHPQDEVRLK